MAVSTLTLNSVVVASEDQVSCKLEGEAALLQLTHGVYYGLDEMGARIWEQVQHPISIAELRDRIMRTYDVDPARCERELLEFCGELVRAGLLTVR
jgi:hypothetical protein